MLKYKFKPEDKRLYFSNDHMANFLECTKTRKEPICLVEVGSELHRQVDALERDVAEARQLELRRDGVGARHREQIGRAHV